MKPYLNFHKFEKHRLNPRLRNVLRDINVYTSLGVQLHYGLVTRLQDVFAESQEDDPEVFYASSEGLHKGLCDIRINT